MLATSFNCFLARRDGCVPLAAVAAPRDPEARHGGRARGGAARVGGAGPAEECERDGPPADAAGLCRPRGGAALSLACGPSPRRRSDGAPSTTAPSPVATSPRASSHTPTRHAAARQVWRPSLAEQRRSDPAGVGWTWERKAGLGTMWRLDDELLRAVLCCTAEPSPNNPNPARLGPPCLSTVSSSQPGALLDGLSHALRRTLCLEGARRRARLRARLRVRSTRLRSGGHASIASHPRTGWRRRRASKRELTTNPNPNPDPNPSPHPRQTMCFLSKRKLSAREIEGDLAAEIEIELEIGAELGAAPRRRSLGARSARSGASSPRDPQPPRRASWPVASLYAARCVAPAR